MNQTSKIITMVTTSILLLSACASVAPAAAPTAAPTAAMVKDAQPQPTDAMTKTEAMTDTAMMAHDAMTMTNAMTDTAMMAHDAMTMTNAMTDTAMMAHDAMTKTEAMTDTGMMAHDAMTMTEAMTDTNMMAHDAMTMTSAMTDTNMMAHDAMTMTSAMTDTAMMAHDAMTMTEAMTDTAMMAHDAMTMTNTMMELPAWQTLSLTDAKTGEAFTLADYRGKTVYVELMATGCPNCKKQLGYVTEAKQKLANANVANVVFVALSVESDLAPAKLAQYAEDTKYDLQFAVLNADALKAFGAAFGRSALNPTDTPHFIIHPDFTVTKLKTGIEDTDALIAALSK